MGTSHRPRGPSLRDRVSHAAKTGLGALLARLDGEPYEGYRALLGRHELGEFALAIDRVPPDPFAGPALVRVSIDRAKAKLPSALAADRPSRLGVEDFLAREADVALALQGARARNAPPGSGWLRIAPSGAAVVERSSCHISEETIELRLEADLPTAGRRILGLQAEKLLCGDLQRLATSSLLFSSRRLDQARAHAEVVSDHAAVQLELERQGCVAWIGEGSRLGRDSRESAVLDAGLMRSVSLPGGRVLRGLAIPAGVTLVAGGAFSGKSTLIRAMVAGVRPHPPSDGRCRVVTVSPAASVRAERGRSVRCVDLSLFFQAVPHGQRVQRFSQEWCEDGLSQAASVVEAIELGVRVLFIDEDSSAISFLARDGRMQRLVPRALEPAVAFLDRARDLHRTLGISTVLASGSCGDYLEAADTVLLVEGPRIQDATMKAREIASGTRSSRLAESLPPASVPLARRVRAVPAATRPIVRVGLKGAHGIRVGDELVDLEGLDTIEEPGEARAIALLLREALRRLSDWRPLAEIVDELDAWIESHGLDALEPKGAYDLARPRRLDIGAALNRFRSLAVEHVEGS